MTDLGGTPNAPRTPDQDIVPMLEIFWLDEALHRAAVTAVLTASLRRLSLVDCASFETMRRRDLARAFTFDHHFAEQGFEIIPDFTPPAPAPAEGRSTPRAMIER